MQYNPDQMFGFIHDESNNRYFVHLSSVQNRKTLFKGDMVMFDPVADQKGAKAVNVVVLDSKSTGQRLAGTVKWFDPAKKIGYIISSDGQELFLHQTELQNSREVSPGQAVTFEIKEAAKGPKAILVRVVRVENK